MTKIEQILMFFFLKIAHREYLKECRQNSKFPIINQSSNSIDEVIHEEPILKKLQVQLLKILFHFFY